MQLALEYESLAGNVAWLDFQGRLYGLHEELGREILAGRFDEWGNDLTPRFRAAFGLLEQIIAIPAGIKSRYEFYKQQEMGLGPGT